MNSSVNSWVKIIAAAAGLAGSLHVGAETIERSSPADSRGDVEINNVTGSVHVIGWDRAEVQVSAQLGRGVERLDFQHDGSHTFIQVVNGRHNSGDSDLTIRVPRDSRVITSTVSADQRIEDVHGAQRLQSVSGDLRTQVWSGELEARTVSGEIDAVGEVAKSKEKSRAGRMHLNTVSGEIYLENLGEDFEASTVSGDMRVRAPSVTRALLKTTNGSVVLDSVLAPDARVDAESINGDLTLNLDAAVDAEFEVESFNGRIKNCFGPKPKRKSEYGPGTELRFKEGEGRAQVRIKTLNGKVTLCRGTH